MQAREIKNNAMYGQNLIGHDTSVTANSNVRQNNTFKSNFSFNAPATSQPYDYKGQSNRNKQFVDTPLQPGATRQSY